MSKVFTDAMKVQNQLKELQRKAQQKFLGEKECPECDGAGEVEYEVGVPAYGAPLGGELEVYVGECENCNGNGWIEFDGMDDDNWEDGHGS